MVGMHETLKVQEHNYNTLYRLKRA